MHTSCTLHFQLLIRHHSVQPRVRRSNFSDLTEILSGGNGVNIVASLAAHAAIGAVLIRSYLGLAGGEIR